MWPFSGMAWVWPKLLLPSGALPCVPSPAQPFRDAVVQRCLCFAQARISFRNLMQFGLEDAVLDPAKQWGNDLLKYRHYFYLQCEPLLYVNINSSCYVVSVLILWAAVGQKQDEGPGSVRGGWSVHLLMYISQNQCQPPATCAEHWL